MAAKETSINAYDSAERVADYDVHMEIMHPNRAKMVSVGLEFLPVDSDAALKAVDLGVGTGFFTAKFFERFPNATVCAVDGAPAMVDLSKARLGSLADRVKFVVGDFRDLEKLVGSERRSVVLSSFALHHLDGDEKTEVYRQALRLLNAGGWLINADCVIGETRELETRFQQMRVEGIVRRARGEHAEYRDSVTTRKTLDDLEATEGDKPIKISEELRFLKRAGFVNVSTIWQEYREAVMCGQKEQ